jgi:hypothetical protein
MHTRKHSHLLACTRPGAKTGRSPKDKRVVKEPSTEKDVWWRDSHNSSPNYEIDERWAIARAGAPRRAGCNPFLPLGGPRHLAPVCVWPLLGCGRQGLQGFRGRSPAQALRFGVCDAPALSTDHSPPIHSGGAWAPVVVHSGRAGQPRLPPSAQRWARSRAASWRARPTSRRPARKHPPTKSPRCP